MEDTFLTLEVFYKKNGGETVQDLARVLYGPFDSRVELDDFFQRGVDEGFFNSNMKAVRVVNKPSFDSAPKES